MEDDSSHNNQPQHPEDKPEGSSPTSTDSKWTLKIKTPTQEKQVEVEEDARVKTVRGFFTSQILTTPLID
jgi:hypothetical protein